LKAPAPGSISAVNVRAGETTQQSASKPAVILLPDDPYEIQVNIYEEDIVKANIGDSVNITITALPGNTYTGKVKSIDPAGTLISGVIYYLTKISFDNPPVNLKPEMTADVVIVTASGKNAVLVPESVIITEKNKDFIQILKTGVPQKTEVKTGIRSKGMAEILSGLSEGDAAVIQ
jgi:RND family efflux transporter MFP subunit